MSATSPVRPVLPPDIRARKGQAPLGGADRLHHARSRGWWMRIATWRWLAILVGMVLHGMPSTIGVTMEMMILHGRAVVRGLQKAMAIIDMPFGSYEESPQQAYRNAARLMAETGAPCVKLEGGVHMAETIAFLTKRGIPVHGAYWPDAAIGEHFGRLQGGGPRGRGGSGDAGCAGDRGGWGLLGRAGKGADGAGGPDHPAPELSQPLASVLAWHATGKCWSSMTCWGFSPNFARKFVKRYAALGALGVRCDCRLCRRGAGADISGRGTFLRRRAERQAALTQIVRSVADLRALVRGWKAAGEVVGVVPTMGALHEGHLSLARAAKAECERVIVTIFVNPKQFNNPDDLKKYPRTEQVDATLLRTVGVDVIFAPEPVEVYPAGFATVVSVSGVAEPLEGALRPGHFDGVATVVAKLFGMTMADRAYFGQKDWQQLQVVKRLVRDLNIPVWIVGCETIREADGLAMSSRNARLDADARAKAPALYAAMMRGSSGDPGGAGRRAGGLRGSGYRRRF